MTRRALFVGIDKYTHGIPELSCARNDANALLEYFMKHGYAEDEVSILRDGETSEILDELDKQTKRLKPGDLFLFFFAGHGYTIEKSDGTFDRCLAGADDRRERILKGKEGISLSEIKDRADKAKCSFVVILDACQTKIGSSRAVNINGKDICNKRDLLAISSVVNRKRNNGPSAPFIVINSCDVGEVAYELEDVEQGLFTFSMLEIFKQMDQHGEIPVFDSKLVNQIEGRMNSHENGYVQHPKLIIPDSCDCSGICIFPGDYGREERERLSYLHQNHLENQRYSPATKSEDLSAKSYDQIDGRCREQHGHDEEYQRTAHQYLKNGLRFYNGNKGFPQDFTEAVKCFRKAAEFGLPDAQYSLGACYSNGQGVKQNYKEALRWIRLAAKQGHDIARKTLVKHEQEWLNEDVDTDVTSDVMPDKVSVVLKDFGRNKQSVLRVLQKLYCGSPSEIKRKFKSVPVIVGISMPKDEADLLIFQLEKYGAAVEVFDGRYSEAEVRSWTESVRESRSWTEKLRSWTECLTDHDAVHTITVSVILLGGTYVLAKLLVWWLFT